MLVSPRKMLEKARQGGYAVGAFNVENAEMVWAVAKAAQELNAPVIIQTTPGTLRYFSPFWFVAMANCATKGVSAPIALHLDHGNSYELAETCLNAGYTSLMIDGSALSFKGNMNLTRQVCQMAAASEVPVEGELGIIGGKEDDTTAERAQYTDPLQAAEFIRDTGVFSLAIALGTAHGYYEQKPILNLNLADKTRSLTDAPLVLHGASGLQDNVIDEAVLRGMAKVNFATELRDTYTKAVRAHLAGHPGAYDPKDYGKLAREAVKELVMYKIKVCGSDGKA